MTVTAGALPKRNKPKLHIHIFTRDVDGHPIAICDFALLWWRRLTESLAA